MKERLAITLSVKVGGVTHEVPGGDVRALSLEMTSHGVSGSVSFVVQDDQAHGGKYKDEVLADFQKPDLGEVEVSVKPSHWDTSLEKSTPAIATRGLILDKRVTEHTYVRGFDAAVVLFRTYTVTFVDAARGLWRQHFPCNLVVTKSFKDVIEAYKGSAITATYSWDVISTARPLIFFHLDPDRGASFYDLLVWFVREQNGVFTFDHAEGTYSFADAKPADGTAATLSRDEVMGLTSELPPTPRWQPRVLNTYAEAPKTEPIENAQAATSITRDVLLRTPVAGEVDARVTLEKARPLAPLREVILEFRCMPTVAVAPGSLLDVSSKGGFSEDLIASTEPFRVYSLELAAEALKGGPEIDYGDVAADFEVSLAARLEQKSDKAVRLPAITEPRFPGYLEGKVVSEQWEDTDLTYNIYQDADTSVDQYKVKIPIFENQIITCPFDPYQGSGNFYIPAYRDARVLVELYFDRANIARLLDWRPGARVPMEGQGEHLLLGVSDKSNTSILHDYEDKKPVLQIKRTNEKDTAMVRIEEGKLTIQVKENQG